MRLTLFFASQEAMPSLIGTYSLQGRRMTLRETPPCLVHAAPNAVWTEVSSLYIGEEVVQGCLELSVFSVENAQAHLIVKTKKLIG